MYKIQVVIFASAFTVILVTASSVGSAHAQLRFKRASSDQRIAELQALIALSRGRSTLVGHGELDPRIVGKRNGEMSDLQKEQRIFEARQIIRRLLDDFGSQNL